MDSITSKRPRSDKDAPHQDQRQRKRPNMTAVEATIPVAPTTSRIAANQPPSAITSSTIATNNNNSSNPSNVPSNTDDSNSIVSKPHAQNIRDQTSLRYISKRVSHIVEEKKTTTYNEVANELVAEASILLNDESTKLNFKERRNHEKNIRRRVYDALNVLLATDIITKTKTKDHREKVIHWKGFPSTGRNDMVLLEREKQEALMEVEAKKRCLEELLIQNVCFSNLDQRNVQREESGDINNTNGDEEKINESAAIQNCHGETKIALPFIVVNTSEKAVIQCEMNREKTDVMFDFNMPFEINDDNEILKRLGMDKTTMEHLKNMLPSDIFRYCHENHLFNRVLHIPGQLDHQRHHHHHTTTSKAGSKIMLPPRHQYPVPSTKNDEYHHPHHQHYPPSHLAQPPPPPPPTHGYNSTHPLPSQAAAVATSGPPPDLYAHHQPPHHHPRPLPPGHHQHHHHPSQHPQLPPSHGHYSQHPPPPSHPSSQHHYPYPYSHSHPHPHSHPTGPPMRPTPQQQQHHGLQPPYLPTAPP